MKNKFIDDTKFSEVYAQRVLLNKNTKKYLYQLRQYFSFYE